MVDGRQPTISISEHRSSDSESRLTPGRHLSASTALHSDGLTGLISPPPHLIPPAALRLRRLNIPKVCPSAQVEGAAGRSNALSGGNADTPGRSQVPVHRLTHLPATGPAPPFAIIRKSSRGDHATLWSSKASVERPRLPDSVAESRFKKKARDKRTDDRDEGHVGTGIRQHERKGEERRGEENCRA